MRTEAGTSLFKVLRVVGGVGGDRLVEELLDHCHNVQVTIHGLHVPQQRVVFLQCGVLRNDLLQGALLGLLNREVVSGWFDAVGGVTDDARGLSEGIWADRVELRTPCSATLARSASNPCRWGCWVMPSTASL